MTLGRHTYFLGTDKSDNTVIGSFTSVAGGTYIHGPDNHACIRNNKLVSTFDQFFGGSYLSGYSKGIVEIGNDVWIGEDVKIMSGVKIGDGAIIGAHTVLAKDVPPYAVVVGNPQVVKKYRFPKKYIDKMLKIAWWNWSDDLISQRREDFDNIDIFVKKYYEVTK